MTKHLRSIAAVLCLMLTSIASIGAALPYLNSALVPFARLPHGQSEGLVSIPLGRIV